MELDIITAVIITVIAIIFSGLFSGTEIAFVQSNKVRMEIDATKGGVINRIIHSFTRHEDMFISTLLVGNNTVLVIYGITISVILNPWLEKILSNEALVLVTNTVISTLIILVTGEFLPKTIFRINPNFMMRVLALPIYLIYIIIYPLSLLTTWISKWLMRLFGLTDNEETPSLLTIEQLDDYIQHTIENQTGSETVENEVKIFRNAIDFKDTQIKECMIPRNEITAVNIATINREDLLQKFIATGLSKIVVFEQDIDNVLGYIHISELFNPEADLKQCLKPVIFTPETKLAENMMRRLLTEKRSMAIIVDEFGGTAGLVTLEDLVEEIFGEIEDEHDRKKLIARRLPDGEFEFSGRTEIENINEEFGLHIAESDEYHTLAGFLLENLGELPSQGRTIDLDGYRFTIEKMSDTRIELVKVSPIEPSEE